MREFSDYGEGVTMAAKAWFIHLNGIVQGVGFRPFVYKLAHELGVKGWVNNSSQGLYIHAEGEALETFYERLLKEAPKLAQINFAEYIPVQFKGYDDFSIVPSKAEQLPNVLISPDVATCEECLQDIRDPGNRRYRYPFTNCTNCGPRYTIIKKIPYDRIHTTMADFPMCPECAAEYQNPADRRFHAQPVACARCGPSAVLLDRYGNQLPGLGIDQLLQGAIVAVKGLGGFHLACDARNESVVRRLRAAKERGAKPFAVMMKDLETARRFVELTPKAEEVLLSSAAPIVIAPKTRAAMEQLAKSVAPGIHTLGVMLPYTPLHHLIFEGPLDVLVMTSANLSGKPLIYQNHEALSDLRDLADYFLVHNRDIYHPCDDSVVQIIGDMPVFFRRARGYVPLPIVCPEVKLPLLGTGGELKNAFCLAKGQQAFLSQYLGDMEGYENYQRFLQELESFQHVVNITPKAVGYDLHPNYQTTRFAKDLDWPKVAVQHHHAHLVSVLGEYQIAEPTLGVICDGTGYGEDGRIWGFEFLYGNHQGYERKGHLEYLPLPGGDAGAKHPLRIAYAYAKTLLEEDQQAKSEPLWARLTPEERTILDKQLRQGFQVFWTSSAGRLFDAVSALLDICTKVTYEGQAAIELESAATLWQKEGQNTCEIYPIEVVMNENGPATLSVKAMYRQIITDILNHRPRGEIAYKFHLSLAEAIVKATKIFLDGQKTKRVVLNGGVFQNKLLTELVLNLFNGEGIEVLRAKALPPGDGGLAFGQVLIANEVLKRCV